MYSLLHYFTLRHFLSFNASVQPALNIHSTLNLMVWMVNQVVCCLVFLSEAVAVLWGGVAVRWDWVVATHSLFSQFTTWNIFLYSYTVICCSSHICISFLCCCVLACSWKFLCPKGFVAVIYNVNWASFLCHTKLLLLSGRMMMSHFLSAIVAPAPSFFFQVHVCITFITAPKWPAN